MTKSVWGYDDCITLAEQAVQGARGVSYRFKRPSYLAETTSDKEAIAVAIKMHGTLYTAIRRVLDSEVRKGILNYCKNVKHLQPHDIVILEHEFQQHATLAIVDTDHLIKYRTRDALCVYYSEQPSDCWRPIEVK